MRIPLTEDQKWLMRRRYMLCDRLHRSLIERSIGQLGLHRSQHTVLMFLSKCEQQPTQKDIAEEFQISAAAVAATIKKLEKGGYVEREEQKDDRRFNRITITPKGQKIVEKSRAFFRLVDEAMYYGFSAEELDTFYAFFSRMEENLYALERSISPENDGKTDDTSALAELDNGENKGGKSV